MIKYTSTYLHIIDYTASIYGRNCYLRKNKQGRTQNESALAAVKRKIFAKTES